MLPITVGETSPGSYFFSFEAGSTDVDDVIDELGHEPNGYFWEGVAQLLVSRDAPKLDGRFEYDPEAGMFVAYGSDRPALTELAELMTAVASDPERMRKLVEYANKTGFEFDD